MDAKARGPNEQNACNLLQRLARPPVHSSAVKTNFASMYRIWSSNESPKPSRPIALTVSLTYRMRTSQNSSLLAPPSARHIPAHALKQGWSCTPAWTTSLAALLRAGHTAQLVRRRKRRAERARAGRRASHVSSRSASACWRRGYSRSAGGAHGGWSLRVDRLEAIVCAAVLPSNFGIRETYRIRSGVYCGKERDSASFYGISLFLKSYLTNYYTVHPQLGSRVQRSTSLGHRHWVSVPYGLPAYGRELRTAPPPHLSWYQDFQD